MFYELLHITHYVITNKTSSHMYRLKLKTDSQSMFELGLKSTACKVSQLKHLFYNMIKP